MNFFSRPLMGAIFFFPHPHGEGDFFFHKTSYPPGNLLVHPLQMHTYIFKKDVDILKYTVQNMIIQGK